MKLLMLLPILTMAGKEKTLLENVKVLALSKNKMTSGNRHAPVPQLTCKGRLCSEFMPSTVMCTNMGSDGRDVQWKCEADMPEGYRFGALDVSCEGWSYPDDPFILAGSCGLTYELEGPGSRSYNDYDSYSYSEGSSRSSFGSLVWWLAVAVLAYAAYRVWKGRPDAGGFNGGGGGFRPDPFYPGAPPPYSEGPKPYGANYGGGASQGPGFWSGLLGGGALGYMMGNRGNRNQGYGGNWQAAPTRTTTRSSTSRSGGGGGVRSGFASTSRR